MKSGGNGDPDRPEGDPPKFQMPAPGGPASGSDADQPQPRVVVSVEEEPVAEGPSSDATPRDTRPEEKDHDRRVAPPPRGEMPRTEWAPTRREKRESTAYGVVAAVILAAVVLTLVMVLWNFFSSGNGSDHASKQAVQTTAPETTGTLLDNVKYGAVPGGTAITVPTQGTATTTPAQQATTPEPSAAPKQPEQAPVQTASTRELASSAVTSPPAPVVQTPPAPPTTHTNCVFVSGERPMVGEKHVLRCDEGQFLARAEYKGEGVFAYSDFGAYDAPK